MKKIKIAKSNDILNQFIGAYSTGSHSLSTANTYLFNNGKNISDGSSVYSVIPINDLKEKLFKDFFKKAEILSNNIGQNIILENILYDEEKFNKLNAHLVNTVIKQNNTSGNDFLNGKTSKNYFFSKRQDQFGEDDSEEKSQDTYEIKKQDIEDKYKDLIVETKRLIREFIKNCQGKTISQIKSKKRELRIKCEKEYNNYINTINGIGIDSLSQQAQEQIINLRQKKGEDKGKYLDYIDDAIKKVKDDNAKIDIGDEHYNVLLKSNKVIVLQDKNGDITAVREDASASNGYSLICDNIDKDSIMDFKDFNTLRVKSDGVRTLINTKDPTVKLEGAFIISQNDQITNAISDFYKDYFIVRHDKQLKVFTVDKGINTSPGPDFTANTIDEIITHYSPPVGTPSSPPVGTPSGSSTFDINELKNKLNNRRTTDTEINTYLSGVGTVTIKSSDLNTAGFTSDQKRRLFKVWQHGNLPGNVTLISKNIKISRKNRH